MRNLDFQVGLLVQDINREVGTGRAYLPGGGITWHPVRDWEWELGYHPLGFPQVGGAYRLFKEGRLQVLEVRSRLSHDRIHIGFTGSFFTRKDQGRFSSLYRRLKIEPEDYYYPYHAQDRALRLFEAGEYYRAARAYAKLVSRFPAYLHVDSLSFALGMSYQRLGLHGLAREVFGENLRKYPDGNHTRLIADNMRELMRLDYLQGEYDSALFRDSLFRELFPQSPFTPTFDYFSAQIRFSRGEFSEALPLYAGIPKGHRYFPQARHNLALCHIKMNDEGKGMEILSDLLENSALGDSDRDLRESARTKLGMLLFKSDPARAEAVLAGTDPRSAYRDEALVVRAWMAMRRSEFQQVDTLSSLILDSLPRSVLAKEACFLKAYAAYRTGRNREARHLADSVLTGDWTGFFLPEEKTLIERAHAEYDAYDSLRKDFSLGIALDRSYRHGMSQQATLEEFRRRHLQVAALKKRLDKAERYARSRGQLEVVAARVREMSGPGPE